MKLGTAAEQARVDARLAELAEKATAWVEGLSEEELVAACGCACEAVRLRWSAERWRLEQWELLEDVDVEWAVALRWQRTLEAAADACGKSWHRNLVAYGGWLVCEGATRERGVRLDDEGSVRRFAALAEEIARAAPPASAAAEAGEPFRWADVMTRVPSEIVDERGCDCDGPRVRFL